MWLAIYTQAVTQPSARRGGMLKIGAEVENGDCPYRILSYFSNFAKPIPVRLSVDLIVPNRGPIGVRTSQILQRRHRNR
jgi:hypothetical protein